MAERETKKPGPARPENPRSFGYPTLDKELIKQGKSTGFITETNQIQLFSLAHRSSRIIEQIKAGADICGATIIKDIKKARRLAEKLENIMVGHMRAQHRTPDIMHAAKYCNDFRRIFDTLLGYDPVNEMSKKR